MKGKINVVFIVSIILSLAFGMNVMATGFVDMPTNWAKQPMEKAIENGLLVGHEGKVNPNGNMTRAELATVVNKVFGNSEKADISAFQDVPKDSWYYGEIQKAFKANLLSGSNGKMNPNRPLTREEAFVILGRAFDIAEGANAAGNFKDGNNVADWAKANINGLVANGYIKGANGNINPKGKITRAEFASIIDQLAAGYVNSSGVYSKNIKGNLIVRSSDVILKGVKIDGDLILAEGVLNSNVVLDGVEVTGRILVKGAGRLTLENGSKVNTVVVLNESRDATVEVSKDSSIEEVQLKSRARVDGEGQVKAVYLYEGANNSVIKTEGTTIESKAPGVAPTDGKVIEIPKEKEPTGTPGSTNSSPGGGGGGSSSGGSSDSGSTEPEKPVTPKPEDKDTITIRPDGNGKAVVSGNYKKVILEGDFKEVILNVPNADVVVKEKTSIDHLVIKDVKENIELNGVVGSFDIETSKKPIIRISAGRKTGFKLDFKENNTGEVFVKYGNLDSMKFNKTVVIKVDNKAVSLEEVKAEETGVIVIELIDKKTGKLIEDVDLNLNKVGQGKIEPIHSNYIYRSEAGEYTYAVNIPIASGSKHPSGKFTVGEKESISIIIEVELAEEPEVPVTPELKLLEVKNTFGVTDVKDLRFMVKSIKNDTGGQNLVSLEEVNTHFNTNYTVQDGYKLEVELKDSNLVLKTYMTEELYNEIKEKEGAVADTPYRITVLKGENKKTDKILKLAYEAKDVKLEELVKEPEVPVTPLEPALKLLEVENTFGIEKVEDLKFMVKSITNDAGGQNLVSLEEVNTHFNTNYTVQDGYKLEVELKDSNLVLKTYMTEELYNEIKEKEGAVADTPYRITVLKGENKKEDKILKLAYEAKDVKLEELVKEPEVPVTPELKLLEVKNTFGVTDVKDLRFMVKSITNETGGQKVTSLEEVNTHFNTNYTEKNGYKLEAEIVEGKLVLKTYMTEALYNEIKAKEGAVEDTPYRITVLKGENKKEDKILKLAYEAKGVKLEELVKETEDLRNTNLEESVEPEAIEE